MNKMPLLYHTTRIKIMLFSQSVGANEHCTPSIFIRRRITNHLESLFFDNNHQIDNSFLFGVFKPLRCP